MPINYSNYPPDWKTKIRPDILARANNCCEFCGLKNHAIIHRFGKGINDWEYWPEGMESEAWSIDGKKSTKIILTIAHLNHNIENNDYSNLKALCQRCNNAHDAQHRLDNRRMKKRYFELFD